NIWYGYGLIIPGILFVLITLMLLKSKFPSQLVDASVANELPQMNSKPLLAGRCFIGTVRCSRILDLLCDCGVDAQICDGFCWYVRS
ncbi:inner membrane transport protein ydiN, partial [Shigella flexneri 1235-66]